MSLKSETEEQDYITTDSTVDAADQDASNVEQACESTADEALFFWSEPGVCG